MKHDDAAARLEALGNPTRLRIYRALAATEAGAEQLETPEAVLQAALARTDRSAVRALDHFIIWLARLAGDAAMTRDFLRARDYYFNTADTEAAVRSIEEIATTADVAVPGHDNYFLIRR